MDILVCAAGMPQEEPFHLAFEADAKVPRLCRVVVTAESVRFWVSLIDADEAQFQRVLSLKRKSQKNQKLPAMLGNYQLKEDRLEFKPAFPLVRGNRYQATFDPAALKLVTKKPDQRLQATYALPLPDSKPPRVLSIYPSGNQLPANHLKFYIQFSEPMQQGDIFEHFSLFNKTQGQLVPRPFRHTELWSRNGKQLTLWFHPGRQKTGVNLNVELGAILNAGQDYELRISPKWAALSGHPLGKEAKKSFKAVAMDEHQPDIHKWKLNHPTAGTREPLIYEFDEPLDYALLFSQFALKDINAKAVSGKIEVAKNETIWRFIPDSPWQAGRYQLAVGTVIEDLAGNSLDRPFAIDLSRQQTPSKLVDRSYTIVFPIE
ncbi:Ig-like domain-containing protein [Gimesia algae]|nr:Ig-like domain-containing protein [Gimesia algae]